MLRDEIEGAITERISAFLGTMAAGDVFTMEQIVVVLWPAVDEATSRERAEKLTANLRVTGWDRPHDLRIPAKKKLRALMGAALLKAACLYVEQHPHESLEIE